MFRGGLRGAPDGSETGAGCRDAGRNHSLPVFGSKQFT
jgi:hypothetical protein